MSGGFSGTATSVDLLPGGSQDLSQLPAPLLDVLSHPDHLHVSGTVTDGNRNDLAVSVTFDPPSPSPVPEPTTLATFATLFGGILLVRLIGTSRARAAV